MLRRPGVVQLAGKGGAPAAVDGISEVIAAETRPETAVRQQIIDDRIEVPGQGARAEVELERCRAADRKSGSIGARSGHRREIRRASSDRNAGRGCGHPECDPAERLW